MKKIVLVDHLERDHLLPLTFTRPVGLIRVGIFTIADKWQKRFNTEVSFQTQDYLSSLFPAPSSETEYAINGALIPDMEIVKEIFGLSPGQSLYNNSVWIATRSNGQFRGEISGENRKDSVCQPMIIDRNWKIFQLNGRAMDDDFGWLKQNLKSASIPKGVTVIGDELLIEEGAIVRPCIINCESGPVYVAKGSEIMEGSLIRGGLALLEGAQLKMGAKIYGPTTIGPHSKVGGEVNNAVIFGYSNKGHDGFLGNSVIGEWCNIGADTNTSNLKNNYSDVKIFNYALQRSESTGGQFCGLTMGDHAKVGINTMFNTGTVCGIFANVFGAGFPHRRIPDFGWGGADGFKNFRIEDAIEVAEKVMMRRSVVLSDDWKTALHHLHAVLTQK